MTDSPNEKKFMREKIVKPPINKRRLAGRILCLCLFAIHNHCDGLGSGDRVTGRINHGGNHG